MWNFNEISMWIFLELQFVYKKVKIKVWQMEHGWVI